MRFDKISHATETELRSGRIRVAVDAHVHLHGGAASLAAAARNIAEACPDADAGALMLVERAGENVFAALRDDAPDGIHPTAEPIALRYDAGAVPILIIAGRQVVTAEKVELLLLGTLACPSDGTPLDALLAEQAPPVIAVLPWGFGKWIGQRGSVVGAALARHPGVLPGDIQARPGLLPSKTLRRSRRVTLTGTDPLPIEGDRHRIGGFGQVMHVSIDPDAPATSVLTALRKSGARRYGERHSLADAVRQQWAWYRRRGRAA